MAADGKVRVLLTVPDMRACASPWRETMGLARHICRDRFRLSICALRKHGVAEAEAELRELGVPLFVARFRPRKQTVRGWMQSWRDQSDIEARGPFDIQHSMDFTSSPFEALMARRFRRTFVFTQRNMNRDGHRSFLKCKSGLAKRAFCISQPVFDLFRQLGVRTDKLILTRLGIEQDLITWQLPAATEPTLLCVGHISKLKRQEDAIRTLARLRVGYPDLRLQIVGGVVDPGYEAHLRQLASSLGVQECVEFLGVRSDVAELMRKAVALIHCSETEAFGWVILEAMAVGLPVVASAVEGPTEIVDDGRTGLLVPVGHVAGFENAMKCLIENTLLREQVSTQARKEVEARFSVHSMVAAFERGYEEAMA